MKEKETWQRDRERGSGGRGGNTRGKNKLKKEKRIRTKLTTAPEKLLQLKDRSVFFLFQRIFVFYTK